MSSTPIKGNKEKLEDIDHRLSDDHEKLVEVEKENVDTQIEYLNKCPILTRLAYLFDRKKSKKFVIGGFIVPFSLFAPASFFAPFSLVAPFSFFAPFSLIAPMSFFSPFSFFSPGSFFSPLSFYSGYSFFAPMCYFAYNAFYNTLSHGTEYLNL